MIPTDKSYLKINKHSVTMVKTYAVIIEQDEDGMYIGKVPELKGCVTQGNTVEELISNITDAIKLYIECKTEL